MVLFDGGFGLLFLGVWIFCVIDVITTPEHKCRNLPKLAWVFIVILLIDIGSIAWLVAGRNWNRQAAANLPYKGNRGARGYAPTARPRSQPSNPEDDEQFLAGLRARVEEQRRRAREAGPDKPAPPEDSPTG
jgi:hypothetical protein